MVIPRALITHYKHEYKYGVATTIISFQSEASSGSATIKGIYHFAIGRVYNLSISDLNNQLEWAQLLEEGLKK